MEKPNFCITREKHLDHMVKVVPFIVMGYALQCYFIMQMGPESFATDSLIFLGLCLGLMICSFITYDLKHTVEFHEEHLLVRFSVFGYEKKVFYHEIEKVDISEKGQTFATLSLSTKKGRFGFYFVDDADKIKAWIEEKRTPASSLAA